MEKYIDILYEKFRNEELSKEKFEEGLNIIRREKYKKDIGKSYNKLYLHLGIAFILSSIVYLAAFNWKGMEALEKIGIMTGTVTIPFIIYMLKLNSIYRKLALFALEFLIGILFALFGQVYQTGADSYMLFVIWSGAIAPMVLAEAFLPSYMLIFITSSTGAILYAMHLGSDMVIISIVNIIPLLILGIVNLLMKNREEMKEKIEKFFITLLFMYYLFGVAAYSINDRGIFYLSVFYYAIWAFGIYGLKGTKYYKLLSVIPLLSLIPPIIIVAFIEAIKEVSSFDGAIFIFLFITLLIIGAYVALIKGINHIRGEENE